MEIPNPRRVLAVSLEESSHHLSHVIKALSGTPPTPQGPTPTLSGTTHALPLTTPYYTTTLPVWLDLIASPAEWAATFLSEEAREVLAALGGVVLVFGIPDGGGGSSAGGGGVSGGGVGGGGGEQSEVRAVEELIRHVGRVVRDGLGGWEWDGVGIAVGLRRRGEGAAGWEEVEERWEGVCAEVGLEFVLVGGEGDIGERNEFGEKVGIPRVLEALQANDWAAAPSSDLDAEPEPDNDDEDFDPDDLDLGFCGEEADFEGLRKAIWEASKERDEATAEVPDAQRENQKEKETQTAGDDMDAGAAPGKAPAEKQSVELDDDITDDDVLKLESMMGRLRAVREMGEGMPEEQRKRMAARAVAEAMKEL